MNIKAFLFNFKFDCYIIKDEYLCMSDFLEQGIMNMKKKYKIAIVLTVLIVLTAICTPIFSIAAVQLHRRYPLMPFPGYFNYAWVQEVEVFVKDESILITDRDRARGFVGSIGNYWGHLPVRDLSAGLLSPVEYILLNTIEEPWPSVEWALSTGFDYRFEIVLRGQRDRTLTLVPFNINPNDSKLRFAMLLAVETEQVIYPFQFGDFVFLWAYHSGLPVEQPYFLSEVLIQSIRP